MKNNPLAYIKIDLLNTLAWILIFILASKGFIPWWFVVASMVLSIKGLTYTGKYYKGG